MAEIDPPFLTKSERAFLEELDSLGVRYLLVGMSAALLQGARGATEDIDLWFERVGDERIGQAARNAGGFFVTRMELPILGGVSDRFDVVLTLSGLPDFAKEYRSAIEQTIDGQAVRVLPLERILLSKRIANRAKDEPGIRQIEVALAVMKRTER